MKWLVARLKEPSSHAGIAMVALAAGSIFPEVAPIAHYVAIAFGGGAMVCPEQHS